MKTLLTITFICVFQFTVMAQSKDWRPVRTDGIYMFDIGQEYRALRIDSTFRDADTLHLFGFHEINYNQDTRCYSPKGAPWFGKEIINYPDCTVIKNRFNESLFFPMNPPNEWLFFANETDTVKAQYFGAKQITFMGITDSIRVIQLNDGNPTFAPVEIWISKNYGMIKTYNLSSYRHSFYDDYDYNFDATLAGIEKEKIGVQNLSSWDIFDFMPGDELHILDYRWCMGEQAQYSNSIISIIERNERADTIRYELKHCNSNGTSSSGWVIPKYSVLDTLPFNPIIDGEIFTIGNMLDHTLGLARSYQKGFFSKAGSDSCYDIIHYDKKKSGSYNPIGQTGFYLKGLGGPYHYFQGYRCQSSTELVYYKKGTTEWGIPFNCDSIIGINNDLHNSQAIVFPNPAADFIQVDLFFSSNTATFLVVDLMGKELLRIALREFNNTVSLIGLPKGMFFYHILDSGKSIKKGNFVRQ